MRKAGPVPAFFNAHRLEQRSALPKPRLPRLSFIGFEDEICDGLRPQMQREALL